MAVVNNTEFFVSKLSFREDKNLIQDVFIHEFRNGSLLDGVTAQRQFLVDQKARGINISVLEKNGSGKWIRGNKFSYEQELFGWGTRLPRNISKRKTFVSFYHYDDQGYRQKFQDLFDDLVVSKSVEYNDIDPDNSDNYIKQLIQKDYLSDTTVLVVLLGVNTKCRKHIDWEIYGALDQKVGDKYAGLLGLRLPSHPDFGTDRPQFSNLPERFAANVQSGYALINDWTEDRAKLQDLIEDAYRMRDKDELIINKEIPQMKKNLCD